MYCGAFLLCASIFHIVLYKVIGYGTADLRSPHCKLVAFIVFQLLMLSHALIRYTIPLLSLTAYYLLLPTINI